MDKNHLIQILDNNVKEIEKIKTPFLFGKYDYSKANELLQKTRMLSKKYFSFQFYYAEMIGIKFEPIFISRFTTNEEYNRAWDSGTIELLSIAKAMLDDASLTSPTLPPTKIIEDTSNITQLSEIIKKVEDKNQELKQEFSNALSQKDTEYANLKIKFGKFKKLVLFSSLLIVLSITLWSFNYGLKWNWLSVHPKKVALYISFQLLIIFSLLRIITSNKAIKIIDIIIALGITILSFI